MYFQADRYNRVLVGGNSPTVCIGGYVLGGGTSPISRKFGMAVDNLLEVQMITYDGRLVTANAQMTKIQGPNGPVQRIRDTSLFWALRGGGGGTFGIITKYTFRLHRPPTSITAFACMYPIYLSDGTNVGRTILRKYADILKGMPNEWGGYLLLGNSHRKDNSSGYVLIASNYFGPFTDKGRSYMDQIKDFHPEWQLMCRYTNYTTYLDYIKTSGGHSYNQEYLVNTLMQNNSFSDQWIDFVISTIMDPNVTKDTSVTATGTLLGGKISYIHLTLGHHCLWPFVKVIHIFYLVLVIRVTALLYIHVS